MAFSLWKSQKTNRQQQSSERLAETLPALFLRAEQLANTVSAGIHGRHKSGVGEDFWQFQLYTQGESTHKIDWRQSAKRQDLQIRQHELETNESVWFWLDKNVSMSCCSHLSDVSKREQVQTLYLALALLLNKGYEDYTLLESGEAAGHGTPHIHHFAKILLQGNPSFFTDVLKEGNIPQKSRLILASDFLMPLDELRAHLKAASAYGLGGTLLHVADPAEVSLPFSGRVQFTDLTGTSRLTIGHVEKIRPDYHNLFSQHKSAVEQLAREYGWSYVFHKTDDNTAAMLATLYHRLSGGR
ncbi:MAG: DUF58 domain-containing protein [Sneathiella sp.]|nr:DUF58 domain-containing protein [Sneathiella sp.]